MLLQHNICKCRKVNWLSSKNIFNVIATYYQRLDLIAENTTSNWWNLICYPVSSMRCIWNLLWFKTPTNFCVLSSVMFIFKILWTFSVEQQALSRSLKLTKHQKLKTSFRMNSSTVHKRWIKVNFHLTMHFSANFEKRTPLKWTIHIIKNYWVADWRLKKLYLKWSFRNHRLQEKKITNICFLYGIMRICAHFKFFYACTTTKTLSQHSKQRRKRLLLSLETIWHVKTRVHTSEFGEYLSPQIYQRQILSIYWNQ